MSFRKATKQLLKNPEFQSALVRLSIWLFAVIYIGLGAAAEYYPVDLSYYYAFFGCFLVVFLALAISVARVPVWPARRYFSLVLDITATSLCIILTQEVVSPFYLLYIWIFVSYGTRYGKQFLKAASILSVAAYMTVLTVLGEWERYTFEVVFFLLLLILLPLYQYVLLRKLHQARLDAEVSDRAKSVFLSSMTHELRTPISGIVGMAHLLQETPLNREQQAYLESITTSAHLLDALVGDVLDLSKIEAGGLELRPHSTEIRPLLKEISTVMAGQAQEKLLELIFFVEPDIPLLVDCDSLRLRQVLFNLLSNAIKFTDTGQVELRVKLLFLESGGRLLFEVIDSGIGIAPEHQGQVFERFWQSDSTLSSRRGGAGLGMTITQALVKLMGGEIGLESQLGKGSCFQFWLPVPIEQTEPVQAKSSWSGLNVLLYEGNERARTVAESYCSALGMVCHPIAGIADLSDSIETLAEDEKVQVAIIADSVAGQDVHRIASLLRQHVNPALPVVYLGYWGRRFNDHNVNSAFVVKPLMLEELDRAMSKLFKTSVTGQALDKTRGKGRHPSVLMAEDNDINAKVLSALLEGIGCKVSWARDGEEALELVEQACFDLAFVDLRMPVLDGQGFTRVYREQEAEHVHMPIIALTANTSSETRDQCIALGMDGFLAKPVDSQRLREVVDQYAG